MNAGTLLVNAPGSLASTVTVNANGTLGGNGTLGSIVLNSGGQLAPGVDASTVGTLTATALTLNAGSIADFKFSGSANDLVRVTGASGLTINGGGLDLYASGGTTAFSTLGTYDLFQYTGTDPNWTNLSILNRVSGLRYGLNKATNSGNTYVALTISSGPVWNGAGATNNWSSSANWSGIAIQTDDSLTYDGNTRLQSSNDQTAVSELRSIIFRSTAGSLGTGFTVGGNGVTLIGDFDNNLIRNDSPTVTQTINLPITVGAAGMAITTTNASGTTVLGGAINNNGNTLAVAGAGTTKIGPSGTIGGSGGLTVNGPGTLAINAATSFTGDTRIAAGTLTVGHPQALQGTTVDMNTADSGTLSFGVAAATLGGLKGTRNIDLGSATVSIGANNADTTYSGVLSGGAGLIKVGTGAFTLQGTNTYGGATLINAGTLRLTPGLAADAEDHAHGRLDHRRRGRDQCRLSRFPLFRLDFGGL